MAEYTCKDINGNDIKQFVFGDDGVVYGVINYQNQETNYQTNIPYTEDENLVNLSLECCQNIGQTYDSDYGICYHREMNDADMKIVFNVDNYNGLVFEKSEGEDCSLNLSFDYLIEYDSDVLFPLIENGTTLVSDILKGLNLSILIEKYVNKVDEDGVIYEGVKTLETIYETPLYSLNDFSGETGVILSGSKISTVQNKLETELGVGYSTTLLDSNWLKTNIIINDESIINDIVGQEIKFSVLVNDNASDFSLLMDNIDLLKDCSREYIERKTIDQAPSFNMVRLVDNKKAWASDDTKRNFDLKLRETNYDVDDDRLILNSKEIELSTSVYDAIERDMGEFIQTNMGLLTGDMGGAELYESLDLTTLLTTDVSTLTSYMEVLDVLSTELIDVKSRQTIQSYPLLNLIYERYLNSEQYTGISSNKYDYSKLNNFIGMLGGYWIELIEQVIPSTSIWTSTNKIGSARFLPNKFKYNRYNLFYNYNGTDYFLVKENNVDISVSEITQKYPTTDMYGDIYIKSFSNSATSIGRVSISSSTDNNSNVINEG